MHRSYTFNPSVPIASAFASGHTLPGHGLGFWLRQAPFAVGTLAVLALAWMA